MEEGGLGWFGVVWGERISKRKNALYGKFDVLFLKKQTDAVSAASVSKWVKQ